MYKAYLNNNLFLDTTFDDDRYTITDAVSTKEKGGAGAFTFVVPSFNVCYGQFRQLNDYVDLYQDDTLIFFGRVYSTNQRFDNSVEVVCEGMLSVLTDTIFEPITHDGTLYQLVDKLLASHNSQVEDAKKIYKGSMFIQDAACYRAYENYENTWKRFEDLLQSFGGFLYLYRYQGKMYLDWKERCDDGSTQRIDFGENLIDLQRYHSLDKLCTVFIPLGKADENNVRLDISSVNDGSKRLYADSSYIQKYGYIVKSAVWDDVTVASILKTKGTKYFESCLEEHYILTATAVDLADAGYDINHFDVGQSILVDSKPNGLDEVFFDVNMKTTNLFNQENNRLILGTEMVGFVKMRTQSLDDLNRRLELKYPSNSAMALAVENATRLITGNSGGYVIMHDSNNDTYPDEVLVMDTPDIATARKVWRWNKNGLGYSNTGYNGTFGLAMTIDGSIVADYITSGHMSGERITAGTITADKIAARAITAGKIATGTITANEIASSAITTDKLAAGAVTASKISVSDLQALGATIGGFAIDTTSIHTKDVAITSNASGSVGLSHADFSRGIYVDTNNSGDPSVKTLSGLRFAIGDSFAINKNGYVYGQTAHFLSYSIGDGATSRGAFTLDWWGLSSIVGNKQVQILPIDSNLLYTVGAWHGTKRTYIEQNNAVLSTNVNIVAPNISSGSDVRLKERIVPLSDAESESIIYNLKPVKYRYKEDPKVMRHGFIAQDVEKLVHDDWGVVTEYAMALNTKDKGPLYKYLNYTEFIADVVAVLQSQNNRIKILEQAML